MSYVLQTCNLCFGSAGGCTGRCRQMNSPHPQQLGFAETAQKGCICPPTAERTCQRWDCGRKSASGVTVGGKFSGLSSSLKTKET